VQESAQPTENGHDGEEGEDDYEGLQETQFAPQMKLVDGEWVVDEASTQIARVSEATAIFCKQYVLTGLFR
jgi:hypothetical protein